MKLSSLFVMVTLIAASVVMSAPVAKADGVPPGDPLVRSAGPGSDDPAGIVFTDFQISSNTGTSPDGSPCMLTEPVIEGVPPITSPGCQFKNDITVNGKGLPILELVFDLPNFPPDSPVNCDPTGFSNELITGTTQIWSSCVVASDGGNGSLVTFFGGQIGYGDVFSLEFDGFTGGVNAAMHADVVPEPGSLLLLAIGFAALFGFGIKRSAASTSRA